MKGPVSGKSSAFNSYCFKNTLQ